MRHVRSVWRLAALCAALLLPTAAAAAVPQYLNYQGKLGDASGNPLTGTYSFRFKFYNSLGGGTLLFTEDVTGSNALSVNNGIFNVQIGSVTAGGIPASVFDGANVFLEVSVQAGSSLTSPETLAPRDRLVAVGHAVHANTADNLGTGSNVATFTASGFLFLPNGVQGSSGTFTATGNSQFSLQTSSGILVSAGGVTAPFFSGTFYGDGSKLTGIPAASSANNLAGGAANQIPYQTGAGVTSFLGAPGGNMVLWGNSGAPSWTNTPTFSGANITGIPETGVTNLSTDLSAKANLAGGAAFTGALTLTNVSLTASGPNGNLVSGSSITTNGGFFGNGSGITNINGANVGGSVASANNATSLSNGATGNIPYQSNSGVTAFLPAMASGGIVVGNGSGVIPSTAALVGTTNQVTVTKSATAITLGLPQNIDSTASPSFAGGTFTGGVTHSNAAITLTGANGNLVSGSSITTTGGFFGNGAGLTGVIASPTGAASGDLTGNFPSPTLDLTKTHTWTAAQAINNAAFTMTGANGNFVSASSITTTGGFFGDGSHLTGLNATNALTANSLSGGGVGQVAVQSGSGATTFLPAMGAAGIVVGNGTSSMPSTATLQGTASQVTVTQTGTAVTLSLPATINVNTSGSAGSAANVAGGGAGQVPYQTGAGATAFLPSMASGGIVVGNGAGVIPSTAALVGTANQVTVTKSATAITLGLPQNIDSTASPSFAGGTFTGAVTHSNAALNLTGANGNIVSASSITTTGGFFGDGSHLTGVSGSDSSKVAKIGDTMTGALTMSGATANIVSGSSITTSGGFFGNGANLTSITGSNVNGAVASATAASNLSGGSANQIPYQTGTGATTFTGTPGSNNVLFYNGTNPAWTNAPTLSGANLTGIPESGVTNLTSDLSGKANLAGGATFTGAVGLTNVGLTLTGASGNIVTASSITTTGGFFGDGSHLTNISAGNATTSTNLSGGGAGQLPYQSGAGVTAFLPSMAAGGIVIGNGAGVAPSTAALTGTANQVIITQSPTAVTLSLPQSIAVGGAPSFAGTNFSNIPESAVTNLTTDLGGKLNLTGGTLSGGLTMSNVAITLNGAAGNLVSASSITTTGGFFGDGSHLTGVTAGNATSATNLAGGVQYAVAYQTNVGATGFTTAPGANMVLFGNSGAPAWTNTPTLTGTNFTGIPGTAVNSAVANATNATTATNVAGGGAGQLPFQTGAGATGFMPSMASGGIVVGNGVGVAPSTAALNGTANQVTVTKTGTAITLSLPQSINTTATPTFGGGTFNGAVGVANAALTLTGANGNVISGSSITTTGGFFGNGAGLTGITATNATNSTNIAGGGVGQVPVQSGSGATTFLPAMGAAGIVVGNGTSSMPSTATLQGTANQVTVTQSGTAVTLGLPQNIDATASPSFAGGTLTGALTMSGANSFIVSGTSITTNGSFFGDGSHLTGVTAGNATNLAGGLANQMPYQTGAGATSFVAAPGSNVVLFGNNGAPAWTNTPTLTGTNFTGIPGTAINSAVANATNATSATTATNVAGGGAGQLPFQTGAGATGFMPSMASGGIIVGNGVGVAPSTAALNGTANQVTVTKTGTAITLSLPQSINTTATPTFGGGTFNGNVTHSNAAITLTGANGNLVSASSITTTGGFFGDGSHLTGITANTAATATSLAGGGVGQLAVQSGSGATAFLPAMGAAGIVVGNGTSSMPSTATLQGTANQVTVTQSGAAVTLGLPQNIDATASPSFAGGTFTGNVTHSNAAITLNGANGNLVSASSITTTGGFFGNGSGLTAIPESAVTNLTTDLAGRLLDTGDTMTGALTMSGANSFIVSGTSITTSGGFFGNGAGLTGVTAGNATNLAGGLANQMPYQTGAGATSFVAAPGANMVLFGNNGAPAWTNTPTLTGTNFTGIPGTAINSAVANATNATSATTATNVAGGGAGQLPFQTGAGATGFMPSMASGGIVVGNGVGVAPSTAALNGTANQVTVTKTGTAITLSLPQSINTAATPTFGGGTFNGAVGVANAALTLTGANGNIVNASSITTTGSFFGDGSHLTGITATNSTNATNIANGAANQIPYQTGANATSFVAAPGANMVLFGNSGAPSWTNTPTLTGTNFTGIPGTAINSIVANATTANNLGGGAGGSIPVQSAANTTTMLGIGGAGSVLASNGSTPFWTSLTGSTVTYLAMPDTRSVATTPGSYNQEGTFNFKAQTTIGLGAGTYAGVLGVAPWSDDSGGGSHELAFSDAGSLYYRYGTRAGNWQSWRKMYDTGDSASANTVSKLVLRDASGNFSAGTITAALSGNATTATALAANGTNCSAGSYPLGVDASGNAESCTALSASSVGTATNLAGGGAGQLPYQSGAGATSMLAAGTAGYLLQSGGAGAPSWTNAPTFTGNVTHSNAAVTLTGANGNLVSASSITTTGSFFGDGSHLTGITSATNATNSTNIANGAANQIPYQTGASATSFIAAPGANMVLFGNSGAPSWTNSPTLSGANISGIPESNVTSLTGDLAGKFNTTGGTISGNVTINGSAAGSGANLATLGDISIGSGGTLFFDNNYNFATGSYIKPAGGANSQAFFTSGVERMRVTSNGNIGVGVSTPSVRFQVSGGSITVMGGAIGGGGTTGAAGAAGNTWRFGSSTGDGVASPSTWLYLYNGAGTGYHDLALGNLWVNGTVQSGTWNGTAVGVAYGGTGATTQAGAQTNLGVPSTTGSGASGTWGISISGNAATATTATTVSNLAGGLANQMPYQTGAGATSFVAAPGANVVLTGNSGAPVWSNTPTLGSLTLTGGEQMANGQVYTAKNSAAGVETWMWPRWTDNNTYMNYGSGGSLFIRNNASASKLTISDTSGIALGNGTAATGAGAADVTHDGTSFFGTGGSYSVTTGGAATFSLTTVGNLTSNTAAGSNFVITMKNATNVSNDKIFFGRGAPGAQTNLASINLNNGNFIAQGTITASQTPDLAEYVMAAPDVEAADVVSADDHELVKAGPGGERFQVRKSQGAYDSHVLGVISDGTSAFKINSYMADGAGGKQHPGRPLVLAGRVPVKVTLEGGPIHIGDQLAAASKPGYAMKATQPGATVGIALQDFDGAPEGKVLCFVKVGTNARADRELLQQLTDDNARLREKTDRLERQLERLEQRLK